jgi:uncharacterized protein (DUF433 family)
MSCLGHGRGCCCEVEIRTEEWLQYKREEESMFDRITFDRQIMGGRACIRGMRIPVSVIVGQVAHWAAWDGVLREYPDLERDDIQQSLEYAAWLTHEEVRTG